MTQTIDLQKMGLFPVSLEDSANIDGGIFPLLIIGAVVLLAGCVQTNQSNGSSSQTNVQVNAQNVGDSISNSNHGTLQITPVP
ncbi:MAG: hypothetical protein J0I84_12835 [Terrimonas sp.]|uniref:hypothetical protein n=1 Tax=Terrimonas sp. TaxID=1914338 RepID=UPI000929EF96|nr:hypothetical protein [Terrimonas sp.]MBN8787967.1 hypothetical protein [Terrimonas sp.]OJY95616.1 MAG: hypothetical protein BGP13_12305 [Sphingobacteriales bacterium 40-81]PVD52151.1 hypothetical protein DC498_10495 [Terrimonas sp.]